MSHTATVKVDLSDREMLKEACEELGLEYREGLHQVKLYQGNVSAEFSVRLPGWSYPIAICGDQMHYDNYNGRWGDMSQFHKLQDGYSKHATIQHAENMGWTWDEEFDEETGEITLNLYDYSG